MLNDVQSSAVSSTVQARSGRRIYPLTSSELTEEQIAVTFAMTSRSPDSFEEIAGRVSAERAADFNERWVVGYGHASVAEHAILHLAVEGISRLACDALEDNRLASFTEKSSRYQVIDRDNFHVPSELDALPSLRERYLNACRGLFSAYHLMLDRVLEHLSSTVQKSPDETNQAYRLRLRRMATDSCRAILPASTLTNVGVTANARTMEYAISKLMSSSLQEERSVGLEIREQARLITPTLVKYADHNPYLAMTRHTDQPTGTKQGSDNTFRVKLVDLDLDAPLKIAMALLFRQGMPYTEAEQAVRSMSGLEVWEVIFESVRDMGPHDSPPREFEMAGFTFEFRFDYGALREFRRHRMQTHLSQLLTIVHGHDLPALVAEAGMDTVFEQAILEAESVWHDLAGLSPALAQYMVTHAHFQKILSRVSLRECYHLFELRTSPQAHESIREPMLEALALAADGQPDLFRYLRLRHTPDWWPYRT